MHESGLPDYFHEKKPNSSSKKSEKANYSKNAKSMLNLKINIFFVANML